MLDSSPGDVDCGPEGADFVSILGGGGALAIGGGGAAFIDGGGACEDVSSEADHSAPDPNKSAGSTPSLCLFH